MSLEPAEIQAARDKIWAEWAKDTGPRAERAKAQVERDRLWREWARAIPQAR